MAIEKIKTARGMLDGKETTFEAGQVYSEADGTINDRLSQSFVRDGLAKEIAEVKPEPRRKASQGKQEYK
jgi:hypothetical protein